MNLESDLVIVWPEKLEPGDSIEPVDMESKMGGKPVKNSKSDSLDMVEVSRNWHCSIAWYQLWILWELDEFYTTGK